MIEVDESTIAFVLILITQFAALAASIVASGSPSRMAAATAAVFAIVAGLIAWTNHPFAYGLPGAALIVVAMLLATIGGSGIVTTVLGTVARTQPSPEGADDAETKTQPVSASSSRVLRGGATIGYLERFAVAGSLVAGWPAAVAVVIAVKGLGRFGELDSSTVREQFIIGTLTSVLWAAVATLPVVFIVSRTFIV